MSYHLDILFIIFYFTLNCESQPISSRSLLAFFSLQNLHFSLITNGRLQSFFKDFSRRCWCKFLKKHYILPCCTTATTRASLLRVQDFQKQKWGYETVFDVIQATENKRNWIKTVYTCTHLPNSSITRYSERHMTEMACRDKYLHKLYVRIKNFVV